MNSAAELRLPFDVYNASPSEESITGYARWFAEDYIAQPIDAETIYLAYNCTLNVNHNSTLVHHLSDSFIRQVVPEYPFLDCLFNVFRGYEFNTILTGQILCFMYYHLLNVQMSL